MESISLQHLFGKKMITKISTLQIRKDGMPYVFLVSGNKWRVSYFGKELTDEILSKFKHNDDIEDFLLNADIVELSEQYRDIGSIPSRFKIMKSRGGYSSTTDLLEALNIKQDELPSDFPVQDFLNDFHTGGLESIL